MKASLRRKIAMARRALDFATAHPLADSGYTVVVARLKTEVDQADALVMLQDGGIEREHAAKLRKLALRHATHSQHLRRLWRIAKLAEAAHPELVEKFVLPSNSGPNRAFILKARVMLADVNAHLDVLNALGLGDTFVAELTAALAEFDSITEGSHAARADHVGAGAQLLSIASRCGADVDVIDTFIRVNFANDAQALAAWQSAKNLVGPFKALPEETAPAPVPQPVAAPLAIAADEQGT
jgi:hypothetical protein